MTVSAGEKLETLLETGEEPLLPGGLAVLNPGGSDPDQQFTHGAGAPTDKGHPPVNYHAYAACTAGSFLKNPSRLLPEQRSVLLLLRRDLKLALKTLLALQGEGHTVAISLKESGSHQVAALLAEAKPLALFRDLCARADFCLSSTSDLIPFYLGAGARRVEFIPTPYPVDVPAWDFSRPVEERRGVFIGTREFNVPTRNHLAALLAARGLGEVITVINSDGRSGRRALEALGIAGLRIVEGRLDYPAYLRLMAEHRLVFQCDRSAVPGQVAGDALLCRVPCIGGDGAVERLAFPEFNGMGRTPLELIAKGSQLLRDEGAYADAMHSAQALAREQLSFTVISAALRRVFASYRA